MDTTTSADTASVEEHKSSHNVPSIDVSITTPSPKLDLQVPKSWRIDIKVVLHHTGPITFDKLSFSLLNGEALELDGLDFIDVESGQTAPRNFTCKLFAYPEKPISKFMTLFPEKPQIFEEEITHYKVPAEGPPQEHAVGLPVEADAWESAEGLENGKQYDIKLGKNCAELSWYFEGTAAHTKSEDSWPKAIPLNQVHTPRISVSRSEYVWGY